LAATISENYLSRAFELGNTRERTLIYDIIGTIDEEEVRLLVNTEIPPVYLGLILDGYQIKPVGSDNGGVWNAVVKYVRLEDDNQFTFSTSGGTKKMTNSLATIATYVPAGFGVPDFQGLIGVTEDQVEGVEITVPVFTFSETHLIDGAIVNAGYKRVLVDLTGTMNNANFKGFTLGECLFQGADGTMRGDGRWSITYKFAGNPSYIGHTVGAITGINKLGWDYSWSRNVDFEDGSALALVKRPVAVVINRVYPFGDFSTLLIGT